MARITFQNVTMGYSKKKTVLEHVNLEIGDGEFFVLLGPSGCGKTTLLRLISGISKPTEGDILFDGVSVKEKEAQERNVAMVFQNFALYPHMNVYKNIAYPLASRKVPKDEIDRRVREIAETFGITDLLDRRPRVLSGGQRQLVAIARAMVRKPDVFLLDEPFSNLDVERRDALRMQVRKAHRLHPETTFVYVTHDQTEAMGLADRMAIMKDGKIMASGKASDIYMHPDSEYAALFLGNPKINLIPAVCFRNEGRAYAELGGERIPLAAVMDGTLEENVRTPMHLGIRPENLTLAEEPGKIRIRGVFRGLARAGSGIQILFAIEGTEGQFSSLAQDGFPQREGEPVSFYADPERIEIFEPGEGRNIRVH